MPSSASHTAVGGCKSQAANCPTTTCRSYDGIGANEFIVDVCHNVCDFISTVDTPAIWELNIWYHTLNCGFTTRISGETDFPCIYGDRVGLGRVYVQLPHGAPLEYAAWVQGIREGRSYVGDGLSHLFDFRVQTPDNQEFHLGQAGSDGRPSFLSIASGQKLKVKVNAAAMLDEHPNDAIRQRPLDQKPYWHLERARIGDSRRVPVELIVNGQSVAKQEIEANGKVSEIQFEYQPERSSWIALRIFPSCHTNPIFVEVDGQPILASRRSAQWCLDSVEICWKSKSPLIRANELTAARAAYDVAKAQYAKILNASYDDTGK